MSEPRPPIRRKIPIKFYSSGSEETQDAEATEQAQNRVGSASHEVTESPQARASPPPLSDEGDQSSEEADEELDEGPPDPASALSPDDCARLEAERNDLHGRLLRLAADFDNYRRRLDREHEEMQTQVRLDVIKHLLPIVDNFERALGSARQPSARDQLLEGVELIYKQLHHLLAKYGVHPIDSVRQPFDPMLHEAISAEPSDQYEPDTVIEEYERGYKMGDRLVRPAKVKVAVSQ